MVSFKPDNSPVWRSLGPDCEGRRPPDFEALHRSAYSGRNLHDHDYPTVGLDPHALKVIPEDIALLSAQPNARNVSMKHTPSFTKSSIGASIEEGSKGHTAAPGSLEVVNESATDPVAEGNTLAGPGPTAERFTNRICVGGHLEGIQANCQQSQPDDRSNWPAGEEASRAMLVDSHLGMQPQAIGCQHSLGNILIHSVSIQP